MIWNNFASSCRFIPPQCMRCCMWCFWWFFDDSILITGSRFVGIFHFLFRFWFRAWSYWLYWAWSKYLFYFLTLNGHLPRWSAIFITRRSNILEWAKFFIFHWLFLVKSRRISTEFHKTRYVENMLRISIHFGVFWCLNSPGKELWA